MSVDSDLDRLDENYVAGYLPAKGGPYAVAWEQTDDDGTLLRRVRYFKSARDRELYVSALKYHWSGAIKNLRLSGPKA